jgi:hypothetical protein
MTTQRFTVSDKVVCTRELPLTARSVFSSVPEVGKVYCVRGIDTHMEDAFGAPCGRWLFLVGIEGIQRPVGGGEFSFNADHFRLL